MTPTVNLPTVNLQIVLEAIPVGLPRLEDFGFREVSIPPLEEGQILLRHRYLGLSPSARIRMAGDSDYGRGIAPGEVIMGQTVGVVVRSRDPEFQEGQCLLTNGGWQSHSVTRGAGAVRLDPNAGPLDENLGLLGTSGMTAYVGLFDVGMPKTGETLVVSAASGSVGSLVGQLGKICGCRVVGITSGERKMKHVTTELGFDIAVDHRDPHFSAALTKACPAGIDIYFDNVGGAVRDAVWPLMAEFGRVVLCGMIADYGRISEAIGPSWFPILSKRLTVKGFLLRDHEHRRRDFLKDVRTWRDHGQITYRNDVSIGLKSAPAAFIRMLSGAKLGKSIVQVAEA